MSSNTLENELLAQKLAMLEVAKKKVAELEIQITVLRSMGNSDDLDILLANRARVARGAKPSVDAAQQIRNPSGSIKQAVITVLSDGAARTLKYIEDHVNQQLQFPVSNAVLRTKLWNLRQDGTLLSPQKGEFQLSKNDESSAGTVLSNVTAASETEVLETVPSETTSSETLL